MKLIVKCFFLTNIYFWGVVLVLDKYIFPGQTCFLWGHLRLELSCIWVNIVCSVQVFLTTTDYIYALQYDSKFEKWIQV